jgi:hypothetical protein
MPINKNKKQNPKIINISFLKYKKLKIIKKLKHKKIHKRTCGNFIIDSKNTPKINERLR